MSRDVSLLHPALQQKIKQLQRLCQEEGLELGIGECFRSVQEQDALYAQGRTEPGEIITNAPGASYSSQHQWGIAFDFFKNIPGHAYDDDAFFARVGALGKSIGLGWGGDWQSIVDRPHLYLADWGSTPALLKQQYGTFARFRDTWGQAEGGDTGGSALVRAGQIHCNNFCGAGLAADGIRGTATVRGGIMALQQAMNLDYGAGLTVDGIWGSRTEAALRGHTVRLGEVQYMVTALQILLLLKQYDPNGVESPGSFGEGCRQAVLKYQSAAGLAADGIAGHATYRSLTAP